MSCKPRKKTTSDCYYAVMTDFWSRGGAIFCRADSFKEAARTRDDLRKSEMNGKKTYDNVWIEYVSKTEVRLPVNEEGKLF